MDNSDESIVLSLMSGNVKELKAKINSVKDFDIEHSYKNIHSKENMTLLWLACFYNKINIFKYLIIEHGADFNSRCEETGMSLLLYNIFVMNNKIIKFLIVYCGLDIYDVNEHRNNIGQTSVEFMSPGLEKVLKKYIEIANNCNLKPAKK
jgi:hypothetical protein